MKLVQIAVTRPVTVAMLTLAVVLFGLVAISRLPVTLLPDLTQPTLTIRTDFAGAAPAEIEQLVNRPLEEAVGTVRGLRQLTSIARPGQSDLVLEFAWGTDMDLAALEVREQLDTLVLPLAAEKPRLLRLNPNLDPVVRLGLSQAEGSEQLALREYGEEELRRQLESVPGVAAVRLGGGLEEEIQVLIDEQRTSALNIPAQLIAERLEAENINRAGGRIEGSQREFMVRTLNQFTELTDLRQIHIATRLGQPILLGDLATIERGAKDRTAISRVNGVPAVELNIYREGDANTVAVARQIRQHLPRLQAELPEDWQLELLSDQSVFIQQAIRAVQQNALSGGLLAMLVILLFLRELKPTLIISLAIPVSVLLTFFLMHLAGLSLNLMSLGGMALAIGLLVDNAIVVLENISRQRARGVSSATAANIGASQVAGAITAATLTTLAVFIPLMFVTGLAGELFAAQSQTVTFALLGSLAVALTLIPMLASRGRQSLAPSSSGQYAVQPPSAARAKPPYTRPAHWRSWLSWPFRVSHRLLTWWAPLLIIRVLRLITRPLNAILTVCWQPVAQGAAGLLQYLQQGHRRLLNQCMGQPVRWLGALLLLLLAGFAVLPGLSSQLLPPLEQREFYLAVELPRSASVSRTDTVLQQLAAELQADPGIARSYSVAGSGSLLQVAADEGGDFRGRLYLQLSAAGMAERPAVLERARAAARQLPDVQVTLGEAGLVSLAQPLSITFYGHDLGNLQQASQEFASQLARDPKFTDVQNTLAAGQPELAVHFDEERLAWLDLNAADVSDIISTKIGGRLAGHFHQQDRQIDIRVRLPSSAREDPAALEDLIINPGQQPQLPLSAVARIEQITGPGEITRVGQQRAAIVTAGVADGNLQQARTELQQRLHSAALPPGVQVELAGQSEAMTEAFQSLLFALVLAAFLVYLVMASQFESFAHPLLIMLTVPLTGGGALLALWLTATPLSVMVFIGLIMLVGIVVNNAIVLVDRINQLRVNGQPRLTAIRLAARQRLRPILMTTLTTVLGLTPLALSSGAGAELTRSLAITVIGGLLAGLLVTLLILPLMYQLFDHKNIARQPETAEVAHG